MVVSLETSLLAMGQGIVSLVASLELGRHRSQGAIYRAIGLCGNGFSMTGTDIGRLCCQGVAEIKFLIVRVLDILLYFIIIRAFCEISSDDLVCDGRRSNE